MTLALLLAATLVLLAAVLAPLWKPLVVAAVLAGCMARLEARLARQLGSRRRAALLLLAGFSLLVLVPLGLLVTYLVAQTIELVQAAHAFLQTKGIQGLVALAPARFQPFIHDLLARLPSSLDTYASQIASRGLAAVGAVGSALSSTGTIAFQVAMMLVALSFLLVDGPLLWTWLRGVSPLGAQLTDDLGGELKRTTTSVLTSTVVSAAAQGLVAAIGFAIARVPAPLVFGALTFVAAFIPAAGSAVVGVPAAGVLLLTGHFVAGGFLLGWTLLVTGIVDNFLKPLVARGGTGLSGSVLFFSMIGGVLAFGGVGLLVGPGAVSLLVALARTGRQRPEPGAQAHPSGSSEEHEPSGSQQIEMSRAVPAGARPPSGGPRGLVQDDRRAKANMRQRAVMADGRLGSRMWGGRLVAGLLISAVGVIALLSSAIAGVASAIFAGALLAAAGIIELVSASRVHREERALLLLGGVLSLVVGVLFLVRPDAGLAALTMLLAGYFFVSGLFRLVTSIGDRYPRWGWDFFYGLVAMALGVIVVVEWPLSALWLVGTLVGVELVFRGTAMVGASLSLRYMLRHPERAPA
ncbi:MAG: AI-2E family transporter [Deltaproteobacteria bacterium]|nr:AI-2E family transporter [Deltaproteobacteria bacterium]